jgi:hypothetical protein
MSATDAHTRRLRHNLGCLWPSEIADQFYCEYKVHLKRLHPQVQLELPPLVLGEASHTALVSQAEPITHAEIEQSIRAGKELAICEWVLEGCIQGVSLRGRPDFFAFEGKKALLLLDFKFATAKWPYRDQQVQPQIYGLLAASMGFSTDDLWLGIVMFPPTRTAGNSSEAGSMNAAMLRFLNEEGTLHVIYQRCEEARSALLTSRARQKTIDSTGWKAFLYRYDAKKAESDLAWALGYWLGEREPVPVSQAPWDRWPRKCSACPLNAAGLCEHAMEKPAPDFRVQRSPDGRVFVFRESGTRRAP